MERTSLKGLTVVITAMLAGFMVVGPALALTRIGDFSVPVGDRSIIYNGGGHCYRIGANGDRTEIEFDSGLVGDPSIVCVLPNIIRRGGDDAEVLAKTGSKGANTVAALAFIGIGLALHAAARKRERA